MQVLHGLLRWLCPDIAIIIWLPHLSVITVVITWCFGGYAAHHPPQKVVRAYYPITLKLAAASFISAAAPTLSLFTRRRKDQAGETVVTSETTMSSMAAFSHSSDRCPYVINAHRATYGFDPKRILPTARTFE